MATPLRIVCGWCGRPSDPRMCAHCHHDPALPWVQRGVEPPAVAADAGRPALDAEDVRRRYREAHAALVAAGRKPTAEAIAERLDRSPRTVRDWRRKFAL